MSITLTGKTLKDAARAFGKLPNINAVHITDKGFAANGGGRKGIYAGRESSVQIEYANWGDVKNIALDYDEFKRLATSLSATAELTLTVDAEGALFKHSVGTSRVELVEDSVLDTRGEQDFALTLKANDPASFFSKLEEVQKFVSKDDLHPVLKTTLFHVKDDRNLSLVTTDSYRMIELDVPDVSVTATGEEYGRIAALGKLLSALPKKVDTVRLSPYVCELRATHGGAEHILRTRITNGQFPNHEKLLNTGAPEVTVKFDSAGLKRLIAAVKFADKTVQGTNAPLRFSAPSEDDLTVETLDRKFVGNVGVPVPFGESIDIGLNGQYVLDALTSMEAGDTDTAQLELVSPLRPALFHTEGCSVLVMPVRLP